MPIFVELFSFIETEVSHLEEHDAFAGALTAAHSAMTKYYYFTDRIICQKAKFKNRRA